MPSALRTFRDVDLPILWTELTVCQHAELAACCGLDIMTCDVRQTEQCFHCSPRRV